MTDRASVSEPSAATTCGPTTSSRSAPMMDGSSACSNIIDEFTHECLAIRVSRRLKSSDVIHLLSDLFILRGVPEFIRCYNGPEFVAQAAQDWIGAVGSKTASISPGSPWVCGCIARLHARSPDE